MLHWNQKNFDGLRDIAATLRSTEGFGSLADYCELREKGLRSEAFAALDRFLDDIDGLSIDRARVACEFLLQLDAAATGVHQFLSAPLYRRFIEPTLDRWSTDEPDNPVPMRWLGFHRKDADLLERALSLDPADDAVRHRLIQTELDELDFVTHHLFESRLLGDVPSARTVLARARGLLGEAKDPGAFARKAAELDDYENLLSDWEEYSVEPRGTFPEWCLARNRHYGWTRAVYYDR